MADKGTALDLAEIDRLMGAWLESVEYAPERFLPGEMPDVDDAELMEKGDRSAAGRKAALARWGNRGPVNDSVRAKRSDAARRAAATRRAKKEEAAASGPETDEQAAARMGEEFKAKRDTAEPIDAIDEIAARDDYRDFIYKHSDALGLKRWDDSDDAIYGEDDVLIGACERIRAGKDRHEATYESLSDDERVNVGATAEQFSKDGKVMVAMPPDVAMRIIGGDRAKSQFETNTSRGMFDPETRATHETMASKVHPGIPPEKRPTYGYVSLDAPTASGPANYGDIRFELGGSVRERTTMTLGDSLGSPAIPIKMGDSVDPRTAVASLGWGADVAARRGDTTRVQDYGYAEAQISGGWGKGDVTKVYVPRRSTSSEAYERRQWEDVARAAEAAGIEVERYDFI